MSISLLLPLIVIAIFRDLQLLEIHLSPSDDDQKDGRSFPRASQRVEHVPTSNKRRKLSECDNGVIMAANNSTPSLSRSEANYSSPQNPRG